MLLSQKLQTLKIKESMKHSVSNVEQPYDLGWNSPLCRGLHKSSTSGGVKLGMASGLDVEHGTPPCKLSPDSAVGQVVAVVRQMVAQGLAQPSLAFSPAAKMLPQGGSIRGNSVMVPAPAHPDPKFLAPTGVRWKGSAGQIQATSHV